MRCQLFLALENYNLHMTNKIYIYDAQNEVTLSCNVHKK